MLGVARQLPARWEQNNRAISNCGDHRLTSSSTFESAVRYDCVVPSRQTSGQLIIPACVVGNTADAARDDRVGRAVGASAVSLESVWIC